MSQKLWNGQGAGPTFADLGNDPNLIAQQIALTRWGIIKQNARSLAALRNLKQNGGPVSRVLGNEIQWAIGDGFNDIDSLQANFAYNATKIRLGLSHHKPDDVFSIYGDTAGSGTTPAKALVRLTGKGLFISTGIYEYPCEVLHVIGTAPTFLYSTSHAATVAKLAASVPFANQAREMTNLSPDLAKNKVQRNRDTVGKSRNEQSTLTLVDNSMENLVRLKVDEQGRLWDRSIFFNDVAKGVQTATQGGENSGLFGGLPYMFNPHDAAFSEANQIRTMAADGYAGYNRVFSSSGGVLTRSNLRSWVSGMEGGTDKLVFLSRSMFSKLADSLQDEVQITRQDFSAFAVPEVNAWTLPAVDLSFARLFFIVDDVLRGAGQLVKDDEDNSIIGDPLDWMVAVDPLHTFLVPQEENGVAKDLIVRPVSTTNNSDYDMTEIDAAYTLLMSDMRTGGYCAIHKS